MTDLLREALSAEQRGDFALAKQFLSQALIEDPNNETAWMLMADAVDDLHTRALREATLLLGIRTTGAFTVGGSRQGFAGCGPLTRRDTEAQKPPVARQCQGGHRCHPHRG